MKTNKPKMDKGNSPIKKTKKMPEQGLKRYKKHVTPGK